MVYFDVCPFTFSMVYRYPVNEAEVFIHYMLASCTDTTVCFLPEMLCWDQVDRVFESNE